MDHWELAARESIRDLVSRYNSNGDSGRFDAVLELFTEDATLEVPGAAYAGRAEIRKMFEEAASRTGGAGGVAFVRHFTATHQIDIDNENDARGRCYYAVITDRGLDHWGRYVDAYRRCDDGRWRFARRTTTLDAAAPGGWGASGSAGDDA